jgi:hypothetical protein
MTPITWEEFDRAINEHCARQMRDYLSNHGWFLESDGRWAKRTEKSFISAELSEAYDIEHKLSEA